MFNDIGIFGRRILVLGESHYCGDCTRNECENVYKSKCRYFTTKVVIDFLNGITNNTYTKFERSLIGKWTTQESRESIWESIAFYNYLQYALDKSRKPGASDAYKQAVEPFYQVIDILKPEFIIVWGKRLWKNLPSYERWELCDSVKLDDGYIVDNGYYKLCNGDKAKIFPVYHPSGGYDWSYWHKVITTMIQ